MLLLGLVNVVELNVVPQSDRVGIGCCCWMMPMLRNPVRLIPLEPGNPVLTKSKRGLLQE
jgi:hypothetical protein